MPDKGDIASAAWDIASNAAQKLQASASANAHKEAAQSGGMKEFTDWRAAEAKKGRDRTEEARQQMDPRFVHFVLLAF